MKLVMGKRLVNKMKDLIDEFEKQGIDIEIHSGQIELKDREVTIDDWFSNESEETVASNELDIGTDDFTIELWVRFNNVALGQNINN